MFQPVLHYKHKGVRMSMVVISVWRLYKYSPCMSMALVYEYGARMSMMPI